MEGALGQERNEHKWDSYSGLTAVASCIPPLAYTNTSNKPRIQKSVKIQGSDVGNG